MREELKATRSNHVFLDEMGIEVFARSGTFHLISGSEELEKVKTVFQLQKILIVGSG